MKFGFATIPHWPIREVLGLIEQADALGFDHAWVCDQTFFIDPFPLLAVAGQRCKKINLGVGVTNPYTRTAYQVARTIATVAELVGKPVALGIGAGNRRELLLPLGIEQVSPAARIKEMIEITRRLLAGETVSYKSETMTLEGVSLKFKPAFPAPMYIAARGPATLKLGGETCDGVIIGDLVSDAGLDYAQGEITAGLKKAGRNPAQVENVCWTTCFVTDGDNRQAIERLKPWVAHNLAASPPVVQKALGMDEEQIQVMRAAYSKGGAEEAGKHVTPADIDKLSIVGSPERCAQTIRRLRDRGIGQLVILLYSKDLSENRSLLKKLAEEVFPLV